MHVSEFELEKVGISPAMQSEGLAMFFADAETNLTQHLGISYADRMKFDSIQRIDHHEPDALPAYHEIVLNPKYLKEHELMSEARLDVVKCGRVPHLHACTQADGATPAQIAIVSSTCHLPSYASLQYDKPKWHLSRTKSRELSRDDAGSAH